MYVNTISDGMKTNCPLEPIQIWILSWHINGPDLKMNMLSTWTYACEKEKYLTEKWDGYILVKSTQAQYVFVETCHWHLTNGFSVVLTYPSQQKYPWDHDTNPRTQSKVEQKTHFTYTHIYTFIKNGRTPAGNFSRDVRSLLKTNMKKLWREHNI